ncbi:unnamed protein product [Schistosoma turkestanicum]|nr:unnamed protein product [Schistosoma turkestanicum]
MVCIPCIVIPVLLWILHRLLLPVVHYFIPSLKPSPEPIKEKSEQLNDVTENNLTDTCQSSSSSLSTQVKSKCE